MTVPGTSFVQSYKYDSLYRLREAAEKTTETNWSQVFGYDRYGNRTSLNQFIGSLNLNTTPAVDVETNRLTSTDFGYDKNGNVIADIDQISNLPRQFVFNGDNKQSEVKRDGVIIGRYYYDGEGKRVKKVTDTETTVFVYSSGKLVAEYSTQISETPSVAYTTTDHLGTPRAITNELGQVNARRDFMPFGEELFINTGGRTPTLNYGTSHDDIRQKFTGYQKDTETQLDFAEARMYQNLYGRFTAVDPLLASGRSGNPQSFNRYIYTSNNPIIRTDPTGLDWYRQQIKATDRFTYQWFDENPGNDWSAVDFGDNEWTTVQNWCVGGDCGDGNQVGFLYKSGGHDLGRRANGIALNILSDVGSAVVDTGIGTAQFGYNTFVTVPNVFYGGLARLNLQYFTTGRPLEGAPHYEYWAPANQTQANANLAWSAVSLYYGAASSARTSTTGFAGFSTVRTTAGTGNGVGTASAEIVRRPSGFRKGVDTKVWESATPGPNGGRLCSTCGKEIFWKPGEARYDVWHIDHYNPKWYQRSFEGMTRKQVLDDYNDLEGLRFRCAACNFADNK